MDRVETLLQKLQEQVKQGASPEKLLVTVQMLQHELLHLQSAAPSGSKNTVTVSMPVNVVPVANEPLVEIAAAPPEVAALAPEIPQEEEKIIEVLQIDEAEVEAELEEMRRNAALMQQISVSQKPSVLFDLHEDDIPTLAQQEAPPAPAPVPSYQREINDTVVHEANSINDVLKAPANEISHQLTESIKDLKKAIALNDRYLYINELFRGDEVMYERSIKTINSFAIFPEAEYWIRRELKTKLGWIDTDPIVMQFDQLIKRRFS